MFTLQLALRGKDHGFDEYALGRILELEIRAFDPRPALRELAAQLDMEFRVAGKALEIIEDDNVRLALLGIQIGQHRTHTGPLHEVNAAR